MKNFTNYFLDKSVEVCNNLEVKKIEKLVKELKNLRGNSGRLFFLGVGGSAGNCSHAVNDFRKLCAIEAYAPTDNVSELTARTNDEGFKTIFSEWLNVSKFKKKDAIFIFSVGGGNKSKKVSENLISAIDFVKKRVEKFFQLLEEMMDTLIKILIFQFR